MEGGMATPWMVGVALTVGMPWMVGVAWLVGVACWSLGTSVVGSIGS